LDLFGIEPSTGRQCAVNVRSRNFKEEWIPPPQLDRGQRRTNTYFHPERMFRDDDEDDDRP
jgi:hypothetical protein